MIKMLKEKWESYVGPKDERIVAEENRLYGTLAKALIIVAMITIVYANALRNAAFIAVDPALNGRFYHAFPPEMLLCLGLIIGCSWHTATLTKQGAITNNRFAEVDEVPWSYFLLTSALAGLAVFVGYLVIYCYAQLQVLGFENIKWAGNAATATIFAIIIFVGVLVGLVLYFNRAKRNRERIEAEMGE